MLGRELLPTAMLMAAAWTAPGLAAQAVPHEDVIHTSAGDLTLTFVGHASLMLRQGGHVIQVDPVGREGDYTTLPDADLVLVTHGHGDHMDPDAIADVRKDGTRVLGNAECAEKVQGCQALANGDQVDVLGIHIEAVPAYNLVHERAPGQPFHPKGLGNGYVLTFGDTRVYIAGDTENTPEMKALKDIDVAFLPMNLPYTMTPEMVADAARAFRPRILYPYHYGDTDPQELVKLLGNEKDIEVRVRELK